MFFLFLLHLLSNSIIAGLAETLRSELLLYSVSVHIFFPGTIYSPGYVEENKTKPKITLKIEETDEGMKPEDAAQGLLNGMLEISAFLPLARLSCIGRCTKGSFPHFG